MYIVIRAPTLEPFTSFDFFKIYFFFEKEKFTQNYGSFNAEQIKWHWK